jgi:hypothetical protein
VPHAQHLVDRVGHNATVLDAVLIVACEPVGPAYGFYHPSHLFEDDSRVISHPHGRRVETVHAVVAAPLALRPDRVAGNLQQFGITVQADRARRIDMLDS